MLQADRLALPASANAIQPTGDERGSRSRAVRAPIAEVSAYLQKILGQRLTAVIANVNDPKAVGEWSHGTRQPHPKAEQRLRAAFQIAVYLSDHEGPGAIRAWFIGMDPELDDQAPAEVLASGSSPRPVMQAARSFVMRG